MDVNRLLVMLMKVTYIFYPCNCAVWSTTVGAASQCSHSYCSHTFDHFIPVDE